MTPSGQPLGHAVETVDHILLSNQNHLLLKFAAAGYMFPDYQTNICTGFRPAGTGLKCINWYTLPYSNHWRTVAGSVQVRIRKDKGKPRLVVQNVLISEHLDKKGTHVATDPVVSLILHFSMFLK